MEIRECHDMTSDFQSDNESLTALRVCWTHRNVNCFTCEANDVPDFMWLTLKEEADMYPSYGPVDATPPF